MRAYGEGKIALDTVLAKWAGKKFKVPTSDMFCKVCPDLSYHSGDSGVQIVVRNVAGQTVARAGLEEFNACVYDVQDC